MECARKKIAAQKAGYVLEDYKCEYPYNFYMSGISDSPFKKSHQRVYDKLNERLYNQYYQKEAYVKVIKAAMKRLGGYRDLLDAFKNFAPLVKWLKRKIKATDKTLYEILSWLVLILFVLFLIAFIFPLLSGFTKLPINDLWRVIVALIFLIFVNYLRRRLGVSY